MTERELFEKLDQFAEPVLSESKKQELEVLLQSDPLLRNKAEEYLRFLRTIKLFGQRKVLKKTLHSIHEELPLESSGPVRKLVTQEKKAGVWMRYWPMAAVAASVALISTVTKLYMARSLETKQTAYYKELGRKVEQIKKSQSAIMADIAESKEKATPAPANYTGTGFLVSSNGYIATSYHVIKNADSIYIENKKFGSFKAAVLFSNPANDLSILKIESDAFQPLTALPYVINNKEANLGEEVFTLGFPREDIVFGEGSISASTGYKQDTSAYQISVPVNPGNSGGPLFNAKGDVVGIISGLQTETSGTAFATKASVLLKTINEVPDSISTQMLLPKQNTLKNLTKVQQLNKWSDYVFMVRVYSEAKN
jgi:S1-C subfamily serine protease